MKRKYSTILWPILAVVWVAFCFSTLLTAQNSATNSDNNQAVADQLRQMQQQLNEQQQQINRLQGELKEARGQVKLVNSGNQSELVPIGYSEPSGEPSAAVAVAVAPDAPPPGPTVIPAVTPIRVLPVDPPKTGGLVPGVKLGPVTFTPYGFIKSTVNRDSSQPDGDDFPFAIGLWFNNPACLQCTGPTEDPEFHIKARSTRFGVNIEWPDPSPKLTVTGRIEGDFEQNFSEVNNADLSSIRNPAPRLRLAFVRVDYHHSENTDLYLEGGQDWTLFGSGLQPELLETTLGGGYHGAVYTRAPQLRFGWVQTLSHDRNVKLAAEFDIFNPSTGQVAKLGFNNELLPTGGGGLALQLGEAEREGADSDRPEVEGRLTLQFQADKAKGVAPAQIMISGFQGRRTSLVDASSYPDELPAVYAAAFPNGFSASSTMYGGQIGASVPTRWATFTASIYRGGDLRYMTGGLANSYVTDFTGFTQGIGPFVTLDGGPLIAAGGAFLGCTKALVDGTCPAPGDVAVVPQKPLRAFGGFAQVGFPLSRLFNADPKGHNAGWRLLFTVGKDQMLRRDLTNFEFEGIASPLPILMDTMAVASLFYKLNQWATFAFEGSIYASRTPGKIGDDDTNPFFGNAYTIGNKLSNEWQDHRIEFGPIFTF